MEGSVTPRVTRLAELTPAILSAELFDVVIVPVGIVRVPVAPVISIPFCPASGVMVSDENCSVLAKPVLDRPAPPEPVREVVPKLKVPALAVLTTIPCAAGLVMVVVPEVRFPATLLRLIPEAVLLVEEILVKVMPRVILLAELLPAMLILSLITPEVAFKVPVAPLMSMAFCPVAASMVSDENCSVLAKPVLDRPAPPEPVREVVPKLKVPALAVLTTIPCAAGLVMVVPPVLVRLPVTLLRLIPAAALLVEEILVKVAANAPVVRLSAWPFPLRVTSVAVRVPKLVPAILLPVVVPMVKPRSVLPDPRLRALVLATVVVSTGLVPPVAGMVLVPEGAVNPVIANKPAEAPCPISFWPFRSVADPV